MIVSFAFSICFPVPYLYPGLSGLFLRYFHLFSKLCPVNSPNLIRVFILVGRDCYGGSDSWVDHGFVVLLDLCNTVHSCVCLFLYAYIVCI